MNGGTVLRKITVPDEARFHALALAGLARVAAARGRGALADAMGISGRQLDNIFAGSTPRPRHLFGSLAADPTALDELLAGMGLRIVALIDEPSNDLPNAAGVISAMGALVAANADGVRDHNETITIAELLRPHLGAITNIVRAADAIRGSA